MSAAAVKSRVIGTKKLKLSEVDRFKYGNPKQIDSKQKAALQQSLSKFGVVAPLLVRIVDGRAELIDGHHRFDELVAAGEQEADVTVLDIPDDNMARELILALGNIRADWDYQQLSGFLDSLIADTHINTADLALSTGFSTDEIDVLVKSVAHTAEQASGFTPLGQNPEPDGTMGSAPDRDALIEKQIAEAQEAGSDNAPVSMDIVFQNRAAADAVLEFFRLRAKFGKIKKEAVDGSAVAAYIGSGKLPAKTPPA